MNFEPDFIRKAREKFSVSLYPWQQLVISNILTGYETHCKTVSDSFNEEINSEILYDEDGFSRAREIEIEHLSKLKYEVEGLIQANPGYFITASKGVPSEA